MATELLFQLDLGLGFLMSVRHARADEAGKHVLEISESGGPFIAMSLPQGGITLAWLSEDRMRAKQTWRRTIASIVAERIHTKPAEIEAFQFGFLDAWDRT